MTALDQPAATKPKRALLTPEERRACKAASDLRYRTNKNNRRDAGLMTALVRELDARGGCITAGELAVISPPLLAYARRTARHDGWLISVESRDLHCSTTTTFWPSAAHHRLG